MASTGTSAGSMPERLVGFAAVRRSLDQRGVDYEAVDHEWTGLATADGHPGGTASRREVKAVGVYAHGRLVTVVLPASERLDLMRVRLATADAGARLATDAELAHALPGIDAGALPPFGPPGPPVALVDRRVLLRNWVLTSAGDHHHSLRVSPLEIVRLSRARVVDIAEG